MTSPTPPEPTEARNDLRAYLSGAVQSGMTQVQADAILEYADRMAEARSVPSPEGRIDGTDLIHTHEHRHTTLRVQDEEANAKPHRHGHEARSVPSPELLERLDRGVTRATAPDGKIEARTVHLFIANLAAEARSVPSPHKPGCPALDPDKDTDTEDGWVAAHCTCEARSVPSPELHEATERLRRAYLRVHSSYDGECEHGFGPPATDCTNSDCADRDLAQAWIDLARLLQASDTLAAPDLSKHQTWCGLDWTTGKGCTCGVSDD